MAGSDMAMRYGKRLLLPLLLLLLYNFSHLLESMRQNFFSPKSFELDEAKYSKPVSYEQACIYKQCVNERAQNETDTDRITIVSAYFDIGTFQKGEGDDFSSKLYLSWVSTYRLLLSDVIIFSDKPEFLEAFNSARNLPNQRTCFCLVRRAALWSFKLLPTLQRVLNQSNYPRYSPNTVVAEYAAAMHSKYAVMELALEWNPFKAQTFGWADVGIFRLLSDLSAEPPFYLKLPANFDRRRVAFTQISPPDFSLPVVEYFKQNMVWLAGGFFVAKQDVMAKWIKQYRTTALALLRMGLSDTDQQVIYAMYTPDMRSTLAHKNLNLEVQSYGVQTSDQIDNWFYLPFRSRLEWYRTGSGCLNAQCVHVTVRMQDCDKPSFVGWLLSLLPWPLGL